MGRVNVLELVASAERSELDVVVVHMFTRADGGAGEADDLSVAENRLARGDGAGRELVTGGDGRACTVSPLRRDPGTRNERTLRDRPRCRQG